MTVAEHYVTFGVQYTLDPERGEAHPLGMHKDGYAVIEAPNLAVAQRIAHAIFDIKYAFIYDEKPEPRYAPAGELMRIAWMAGDGDERRPF